MGTKYIIELESEPFKQYVGIDEPLYRVKGFNALVFDEVGISKLTPYAEPDLEQVRKEAYDKCMDEAEMSAYKLYSPKIDEAYQRGLSDAWEAARKIAKLDTDEQKRLFGCFGIYFVAHEYSASECIEKIRQYEQTQKELEQEKEEEKPFSVDEFMRQYLDKFCKSQRCRYCVLNTDDFTCGRGYYFTTADSPVSDEEVRRAYAEVMKK